MKKAVPLVVGIIFALTGFVASAAWDSVSPVGPYTVGVIEVWGDGHLSVFQAPGQNICGTAAASRTTGVVQQGKPSWAPANADGVKEILSTLTGAKLAGKTVTY